MHRAAAATGVMMTVEWGISMGKAHEWRKERSNSNCRRRGGTGRGGVEWRLGLRSGTVFLNEVRVSL